MIAIKIKKIISYFIVLIIGALIVTISTNFYEATFAWQPYDDARNINFREKNAYASDEFNPDDIITFWFNANNIFKGSEELAESILEAGKNPGLGIRALHEQGITGEGVRVAIIDQNLALTHPEYANKLVEYKDVGTGVSTNDGSMHGPAVASLLVGDECGTAPGALLYFAAAPSWTQDSQYQADALRWIIEENDKLPDGDKIRVVSVSAAPSGSGSPFTLNTEQWDEAVAEAKLAGILVLDCRKGYETNFIAAAYYDLGSPDDITLIKPGYPSFEYGTKPDKSKIYVPTSRRTTAEEYRAGVNSWQYTGQGGLSWAIPYTAGVLAMGWQINPQLKNDEIVELLFETAYVNDDGFKFINPYMFIEEVKATRGVY